MARALARLRPYLPAAAVALAALAVAWYFAATTLRFTRPMGLPLDDSYIYLTYAKQFGRGEPFTYFPDGGYSAGSTSVLWPMLLAPFWTLGARGHALVWVSYLLCAVLYALTCLGVMRVIERITGDRVAGVLGGLLVVAIAPFAWTALSGMEVAFASALLAGTILLLLEQPRTGPPTKRLAVCLAAASLSRPEATLIVLGIALVAVAGRLRRRELRAAAWWAVPLAAPLAWVVANKVLAGNFFPNTGVAKSHFYLPGFDWTYWIDAVKTGTTRMLAGLFWERGSPLVWPKLVALAWLLGAARVLLWARREQRLLAGVVIVGSPLVLLMAVIASSGMWSFQNYRYIAPAFPLLMIPAGAALAPIGKLVALAARTRWRHARHAKLAWHAAAAAAVAGFAVAALPGLRADARLFAQGAMDTNTQVVAIGHYLHRKLPDAAVMFHDAGAIAYYGDGRVYDMLGLVTNHQAGIANNGPGSRFEFLEALPAARRPTHFAYYPGWLGTGEFFGEVLLHTTLLPGLDKRRLVGDADMQVIAATWDHAGTGERPLEPHPGWRVVDRLDVAHLESERAHGWRGALGRRKQGDPTARWSFVAREEGARGLVVDGGRTIRGGSERFVLNGDPGKPVRLVLRTGGPAAQPFHETIAAPVPLRLLGPDGRELAAATLPAPDGRFAEVAFELPAGTREVATAAPAPYRAFHWFALQPE
jgi:hypothetical protein